MDEHQQEPDSTTYSWTGEDFFVVFWILMVFVVPAVFQVGLRLLFWAINGGH